MNCVECGAGVEADLGGLRQASWAYPLCRSCLAAERAYAAIRAMTPPSPHACFTASDFVREVGVRIVRDVPCGGSADGPVTPC